jgi:hypothetical protein
VIHSGRGKHELTGALMEAQKEEGDEHPRIWKGIQANLLELDNWREYVEFGIHAHITGFFKMKETSDHFYERTGCVYKNITVERCIKNKIPIKPEDFDSLKTIIAYELGHHAFRQGKHGITQFGILKDWKEENEGTDYFYEKCGDCETELVRISNSEYVNFLIDTDSVFLKNKKKILRSKLIIRYLLRAEYKEQYLLMSQNKVKVDEEKVKLYMENKRKVAVTDDPPKLSCYLDYVTLDSYSICCHRFRSKQGIWFNMV